MDIKAESAFLRDKIGRKPGTELMLKYIDEIASGKPLAVKDVNNAMLEARRLHRLDHENVFLWTSVLHFIGISTGNDCNHEDGIFCYDCDDDSIDCNCDDCTCACGKCTDTIASRKNHLMTCREAREHPDRVAPLKMHLELAYESLKRGIVSGMKMA